MVGTAETAVQETQGPYSVPFWDLPPPCGAPQSRPPPPWYLDSYASFFHSGQTSRPIPHQGTRGSLTTVSRNQLWLPMALRISSELYPAFFPPVILVPVQSTLLFKHAHSLQAQGLCTPCSLCLAGMPFPPCFPGQFVATCVCLTNAAFSPLHSRLACAAHRRSEGVCWRRILLLHTVGDVAGGPCWEPHLRRGPALSNERSRLEQTF